MLLILRERPTALPLLVLVLLVNVKEWGCALLLLPETDVEGRSRGSRLLLSNNEGTVWPLAPLASVCTAPLPLKVPSIALLLSVAAFSTLPPPLLPTDPAVAAAT